jgi:hypothetical protein
MVCGEAQMKEKQHLPLTGKQNPFDKKMHALQARGVHIPNEVAVVGFDDIDSNIWRKNYEHTLEKS